MESILNFLGSIRPLSQELKDTLIQIVKTKEVEEGNYFLKEGSVCDKMCFIENGLVGSFYLTEKNDVAAWFMKSGDVFISVSSFFRQEPSRESIIALQDSLVSYITYQEYVYLKRTFPEFDSIRGDLLEYYYELAAYREYIRFAQTAKTRCEFFFDKFTDLAMIIPDKLGAAFLGMEPSTFCRSKKNFFRTQKKMEKSKLVFH